MRKTIWLTLFVFLLYSKTFAGIEPSTYFNIYVPPNNDAVQRNVALIITAIHDSTTFTITDDGLDGDTDDSVSGVLMAGQSYILYIKDNGINDDALYASGGTLKRDGDYFIIESDKLMYAAMSTDSDWQHSFVPAVNKKSVGQKFITYAPKTSYSPRDLNVFAYEDNTTITISKISQSATNQTGYTDVNIHNKTIVVQRTLNRGEDIIHYFQDGRNIMASGETFLIEANKDISVQYGALWGNARDGGSYVPCKNGSSSGELFYFAVPYQANGEQEIRMVSWDDNNDITLERYNNGTWVSMQTWTIDSLKTAEWVGKANGNQTYPTVFRVSCSTGKKVSVFEANWLETGSIGTSDIATMLSSANGTSSGKTFVSYMPPPGNEQNVVNPFTSNLFGQSLSHFYLFASTQNATVTIKDAKTNGAVLNKTYTIQAGRYVDAFFTVAEWQSIYNGTGTTFGPDRPYILIESDANISVLMTNFNDNWMNYFGSSLPQSVTLEGTGSNNMGIPGDTISVEAEIILQGSLSLENPQIEVDIASGAIPIEGKLINHKDNSIINGTIVYDSLKTVVQYDSIPTITDTDDYEVQTKCMISSSYNDGSPIASGTVITVETVVTGEVSGQIQQTMITQGIQNNADDASNALFTKQDITDLTDQNTDSWNLAWVDYDNDGWEDLFITDKNGLASNQLFKNNGNGSFTKITNNTLVNSQAKTICAVWADSNNDTFLDALIVNATETKSSIYLNNGAGDFTPLDNSGIDIHPQYFHGAAWADFDNDGWVDLLITNFFPTRFHQLYRNQGNNTFILVDNTPVTTVSERAMSPILGDYDNDGLVDIFVPNGDNRPNSLFRNIGNFQFEQITAGEIVTDTKNSVGGTWGDFDNDGDMDLLVLNASWQDNDFYLNQGDGSFSKDTSLVLVRDAGHSHGAVAIDVDNDMDLDIFVSNDDGASFLYINDGQGNFTKKLEEFITADFGKAYGTAWADFDKDGFADMMICTHGNDPNFLFKNNALSGNNWINLKLVGLNSNKMALGSKVKIKANGVWQMQECLPVSGFGSQNSRNLHFGLAEATQIDSLVINWSSGYQQIMTDITSINTFMTVVEEEANQLLGITFHDENGNGQKDVGEEIVANIQLKTNPLERNISSNGSGEFSLRLPSGSFEVEIQNLLHWTSAGAITVNFGGNTDSSFVEIPLQAQALGEDLSIDVSTTAWRRGFSNETTIQIQNLGTATANNVQVVLGYPDEAFVVSSEETYTDDGLQNYTWEITSLAPGEIANISIIDSVSLNASTGEFLSLSANVYSLETDLDTTNNSYSEQIEVVGAIDPNDILVTPRGEGKGRFIAKEQWLTYTVRFENMGTYPATYVYIDNQLSEFLDYASFEVISSSHDYSYQLDDNEFLQVSYLYIDLPTNAEDSIACHGYFKYRIRAKQDLQGGQVIKNKAEIIFDFEAPVITNEVFNTLKFLEKGEVRKLLIYPNPALSQTTISIDREYFRYENPPKIQAYQIRDLQGRKVKFVENINDFQTEVLLQDLKDGLYLIEAYDNQGNVYRGKLLKK